MSLEEKRGYKQAAFTRLRSSLSRYIALNDIPNVKLYTDKLKFAFAAYEAAHEVVLESVNIEEHQATYDKESEQFVQTEELFVQSLHSAGACLNAASTSTIDAISQLMNVPRVEIQSFDGAAASYMTFVAVFDEVVGNVNISGQAKLTRLLQFTTGTARDAIDCCALIGGDQGYDEARRILRERFGNPYIITTALIDKLKQQKEVRTPSALRTLADELHSAKIVLKSLNMYSELDNQHHIKEVGARLSSHLWYAWRDRVFNIKRKNKRYATFDEFVEFVTEKADEANDPVYGQKSSSASFSEKSRPSPTPKRATALNNVGSSDFRRKACDVCQEHHPVWQCDTFKKLTIDKRKEAVVQHKLCINCLRSDHDVTKCDEQSYCRAPDCTVKHNSLLHGDVVASYTIDTTVCNNVCMPITPALISCTKVHCLLDTGSTSTFISNKLASQLKLDVTAASLNLRTLNNATSKDKTGVVNISVESLDHKFSIDMKNVYVVNAVPTKPFNVDVNRYSHLRDIDVVSSFDHDVDLLIGQDYARCFLPLDVRKGGKDEPYAVRTPLGYVLYGASSDDVGRKLTVSHFISASMVDFNTNKLLESDRCDVKLLYADAPDKHRVTEPPLDDKCRTISNRCVIPIELRDELPDLRSNSDVFKTSPVGSESSSTCKSNTLEVYSSDATEHDNARQLPEYNDADICLRSNVIMLPKYLRSDQVVSTDDDRALGVAWDIQDDWSYSHSCITDMLFLTKQFSFIVYSICLIVAVLCMLQPFVGNHTTVRKSLTGTGDCNHIHIGENPCWRRLKRFFVSYQKFCDKFFELHVQYLAPTS